MKTSAKIETFTHDVEFCIVGGGISGMCAAIAAARHGTRVALMHDRPMLGGNASSEIRMWVCGAEGPNVRETGIIEEIALENHFRNPQKTFPAWDALLFEFVKQEPNIELFLNCSCCDAEMDGTKIKSVTGWQTTTQQFHKISAELFADCSGDSILAPLTGAEFRMGREARAEFGESFGPETADERTMGMSCLIQARETSSPVPFVRPPWAKHYVTESDLPRRTAFHACDNYWWLELGGMHDSIADTETLRDELLATALGVWDWMKRTSKNAENWDLDWLGFLPGKRESRRYMGAYLETANDLQNGTTFEDTVAYGGWPLDDHDPAGFLKTGSVNTCYKPRSPYGIPLRALYSRNIGNLFFAGRNISMTHAAMSSSRVMATCAVCGQAVGVAAAVAARDKLLPGELAKSQIKEIQQTLLDDDCFLPGIPRETSGAYSEVLGNGWDRPIGEESNGEELPLEKPINLGAGNLLRVVFDSNLNRNGKGMCHYNIRSNYPINLDLDPLPGCLVRDFRVEADGKVIARVTDNRRRMVKLPLGENISAATLVIERCWDDSLTSARLFALELRG